ncbi:MAG: ATP-binding cassette domain-containing protein [Hydrogenibacillus sp.]|nr:ATP-binding cassette domain-containing protein [Hydrogenibacillus sp.]
MRIFRELGWFFKQEFKSYALGAFFLIVIAFINLLPPYLIGRVVDGIRFGTLTPRELLWTIALILSVAACSYVLRYFWRLFIFGSAFKLGMILRNRLFHQFTRLSPAFYHRHRVGDLMAHATNDVQAVESAAGEGVMTLVDSFSMGGLVVVTMLTLDWRLALIALVPMPAIAFATRRLADLIHVRFERAQEAFSALTGKVQENIGGMRAIKAFGQQDQEIRQFARLTDDVVAKNVAVARVDALFGPVITFFVGLSYMLTVGFGALFIVQGSMTLGTLTSFTIYLGHLIWPMLAFGFLFNIMERGSASYERIQRLLREPPAIADRPGARDVALDGDVVIAIGRFTYPGQETPALRDVHVTLPAGGTLGIVGRTGSGKSTLMRLFVREFDIDEGEIAIGGVSITDVTLDALRRAVAYVPQDHVLFSATVRENIAFAKPDATQEEIERAARLAHIHEDIARFPDGYDTVVGERGVTLSGGQKQRLAIARALILNPPILLLDDALSAVDGKTEAAIIANLKAVRQGKTTLISAHRLSAVEHADQIIVLDGGRVIEHGDHAALLRRGGWYAAMYQKQKLEAFVEAGGGLRGHAARSS